jgi:hypothetical protein
MHPLDQSMHRARQHSRLRDIQESQGLLLELVTSEPTILQCFKIIESTCLSQGIFCRIGGQEVSPRFQRFLDDHYGPFCRTAVRAMFTYGFVPWRTRRLGRGDDIPEVLPPGTFSWHTEVGPDEQGRAPSMMAHPSRRKPPRRSQGGEPRGAHHLAMADDDDSRLVVYRLTPTAGGVREEDVFVHITTPPALDVAANSSLYATVPSPLSYLLTDYKNLREAQKRRSHADAWNTTARIVSTFKPNLRQVCGFWFIIPAAREIFLYYRRAVQEDNPSQYLMDFVHEDHFAAPAIGTSLFPELQAHNVWQREHVIRRQARACFAAFASRSCLLTRPAARSWRRRPTTTRRCTRCRGTTTSSSSRTSSRARTSPSCWTSTAATSRPSPASPTR